MTDTPMPPLRVLFVAGSLGGGGAERQLVDLVNNLDADRIAPRLYLAFRRGELLTEVPRDLPIDAFWDGVSRRSFAQRLLARLRCPSRARALHLRQVLQEHRIDVIVSWSLLCSYEAALARRGLGIRQVAYVVLEPQAEIDDAFKGFAPFKQRKATWTYRSADAVLANSLVLQHQLEALYRLPSGKTGWLPNTRDLRRIDRLAEAESPVWPQNGYRVAAAGRLHRQKGFDVLFEAMAGLARRNCRIQLVLLGQGPDEAELRNLARRLGIADQVHFAGFQSNPYRWFRTSDLFVLSSRYEGLPNVLIEALACRVPVVATDCPTGPREILNQGEFGRLVAVDDAGALADAMQQALAKAPSSELRERARQSMIDRYEVRTCLRQLEDLLERVCRGAPLNPVEV